MEISYREREISKVRVRRNNKKKFKSVSIIYKKKHYVNSSGILIDEENSEKRYKFWKSQKPIIVKNIIRNSSGLNSALINICFDGHSASEYSCKDGLYVERLKVAQSRRDRDVNSDIRYIMKADFDQIHNLW